MILHKYIFSAALSVYYVHIDVLKHDLIVIQLDFLDVETVPVPLLSYRGRKGPEPGKERPLSYT